MVNYWCIYIYIPYLIPNDGYYKQHMSSVVVDNILIRLLIH